MSQHYFVVCIDNANYGAALEPRKIYETIPDDEAGRLGLTRVIDESGEDYLYPVSYFVPRSAARSASRAMLGPS